MSAHNTATRYKMWGSTGYAYNRHALRLVKQLLRVYNRQNVIIQSFHPHLCTAVASATWRLAVLSRRLSTCFPIGAPLWGGAMRLTEKRWFRDVQDWVFFFFQVMFNILHSTQICFLLSCPLQDSVMSKKMYSKSSRHFCLSQTTLNRGFSTLSNILLFQWERKK